LNNFNGTFNGATSTLTGGASTGTGVQILGNTDSTNITFASTWAMNGINGTDVDINGDVAGVDSLGGNIVFGNAINNSAGRSISVQNVAANGNVTFNGDITDTGTGLLVNSNSGGEIAFVGAVNSTISTPNATAILLTDNTGANIDFAGATGSMTIAATGNVNGFVATGGGTVSAGSTTNSISTETGQALKITGMTIAAGGFRVGDVNRTAAAATNAIQLENNTGQGTPAGAVVIGNTTDMTSGDAGTIVGGSVDAIRIKDSANVSITGVKVTNTDSTVAGIHVEKSNTATMTTDLSNLELDGGAVGIDTLGGGTGAVTMTINDTALNGAQIAGARFSNLNAGTVTGTGVTIDGQHASAGADGVQINTSNAAITFDNTSVIKNVLDNDFEVSGGAGTIAFNGTIQNSAALNAGDTSGHSINVHGVTGGSVTFGTAGTITDNNQGFLVTGNTGGTISANGTNTLNTGANDAVTITNNTGASVNMGPLAITTSSGADFVATGGGTLTVAGFANTITRTAGGTTGNAAVDRFALDIEGMTIGAVDFESVNATGGANGTRFVNNTGGTITVGDVNNTAGQGGTITGTTDAGVHAENSNVTLNGVTVSNAGNAAGENGVEITHTNATAMTANLNALNVTNSTAARDGVVIDGTGGSGTFNANVQNMAVDVKGDGFVANNGVTLTAGGTNTIKSDTGVGLSLTNISVGAAGANFQSVDVTNGTTNGIVMTNVAGPGTVTVGTVGGAQNSAGKLTTTGNAIVVQDSASAVLQHLQIVQAGGEGVHVEQDAAATTDMAVRFTDLNLDASVGTGFDVVAASNTHAMSLQLRGSDLERNVVMNVTGSGAFNMVTDSTAINTTGTDIAFALNFNAAAQIGNATFSGTNVFTAANASALDIRTSGAAAKTIDLNVQDGSFNNASATAAAANFLSTGTTTFNATIQGNKFDDATAGGQDFAMTATGAQSRVLLNLGGDVAPDFNQANGQGDFELFQSGGSNFRVFEQTATFANLRNSPGTVNQNGGTYVDSAGALPPIPTPPTTP
jgi:hypothetical protein